MLHTTDVALALRARRSWRTTKNTLMVAVMAAAVTLVAIPLLAVLWAVISKGAGIVVRDFPAFFTSTIPLISRKAGPVCMTRCAMRPAKSF